MGSIACSITLNTYFSVLEGTRYKKFSAFVFYRATRELRSTTPKSWRGAGIDHMEEFNNNVEVTIQKCV